MRDPPSLKVRPLDAPTRAPLFPAPPFGRREGLKHVAADAGDVGDRDAFFDLSLDMLCIADVSGRFVDLNAAWTRALGWSLDELKARPFVEFVHPDDRERTAKESAKLAAGILSIRFENRYRCKDGTYRWLQWNGNYRPERALFYAVARDVTKEKAAIAALEERIRELESIRDDLGEARRAPVPGREPLSQRLAALRARLGAIQADLATS